MPNIGLTQEMVDLFAWAPHGWTGGSTASRMGPSLFPGFSQGTPAFEPSNAPKTVSIADRGVPSVSPDPGQPVPFRQPTGASRTVNIADQGALLARPSSRKGTRVLQGAPNQPNPLQPPGAPRTVNIADRGVTMAWPGSRNGTQASDGALHGSPDGKQVDTASLLRQTRSGRPFAVWEVAFEPNTASPAGHSQGSGPSAGLNQPEIDHSSDSSGTSLLGTAGTADQPPQPGLAAGFNSLTNQPAAHSLTTKQPGGPDIAQKAPNSPVHHLSPLEGLTVESTLLGVDLGSEESGGKKKKGGQASRVRRKREKYDPKRKAKRREKYAAKRKAKKPSQAKNRVWRKNHLNRAQFTITQCNAIELPHTKPGYIGTRDSRPECKGFTPNPGYRYIESQPGQHEALVDDQGFLYAFRVSVPDFFGQVIAGVTQAIERFSRNYKPSVRREERRGEFKSAVMGVSFGGGQPAPRGFADSDHNLGVIEAFRSDRDVKKMVRHAMNAWRTWNPGLMDLYTKAQAELYALKPELQPLFPDCPYFAATVNLGPRTICKLHVDNQNLSYGQCCIMPFGDFNHKKGGQLYLEQPNALVELRPGDTLFIPSAAVVHGNMPIADGEKRYSFTLYNAGAIFQWIALNGMTKKGLGSAAQKLMDLEGESRWKGGWGLYRNLSQL